MAELILQKGESLCQRFESSALKFPNANALYINDTFYSYKQLSEIVNKIFLQIPNDKKHSRIGVYCSSDVYTYAAILAVNKHESAYVPLNSKYPISRNKNIAEQCELELILSAVENDDVKKVANGIEIIITNNTNVPNNNAVSNINFQKKSDPSICYILFTSGSTGVPKGVPVSNENVNCFFNFYLKNYDFNETDRFLQVYELTFDVSVFSFFMPLLVGACCYILPEEGIKPIKIMESLKRYKITVVSMVPTVLRYVENYLKEINFPELRYSFFSGDALYHQLAAQWSKAIPNAQIQNFYGPTETTIVCTRYIFDEERSSQESVNGIVPIGKIFEGMEMLIIDEHGMPAENGELCFTGTQVISEYLKNENEDRFFNYNSKRYYKTGDLVSVNEFGNLIFYGRMDQQVKINGYRIELAEIENAIANFTNTNCIVMSAKDDKHLNFLVAFVEFRHLDISQLKEKLCSVLPDYMIPEKYIVLEKFELNMNGKVDRNALLNLYL